MAAIFSPPPEPTFISTQAVAAKLEMSAEHFLASRQHLEDRCGFPLPVPHWKRPLKWRADQVDGWIAAQGLPQALAPRPSGPNVVLFEKAARA